MVIPLPSNWKLVAAVAAGALMCAPVAYCSGRHDATVTASAKAEAAAQKVLASAARAEAAAAMVSLSLHAKTATDIKELREIVSEQATDDAVGAGMQRLLERLRERIAR